MLVFFFPYLPNHSFKYFFSFLLYFTSTKHFYYILLLFIYFLSSQTNTSLQLSLMVKNGTCRRKQKRNTPLESVHSLRKEEKKKDKTDRCNE